MEEVRLCHWKRIHESISQKLIHLTSSDKDWMTLIAKLVIDGKRLTNALQR